MEVVVPHAGCGCGAVPVVVLVLALAVVNLFALSRIFLTTDSSIIEVNRQHRRVYKLNRTSLSNYPYSSAMANRG